MTIRSKVLLLSLVLFSIPYVGYEYVREMEQYLRDHLEVVLQQHARALASISSNRADLFQRDLYTIVGLSNLDYFPPITPLSKPIQVDGEAADWQPYQAAITALSNDHIIFQWGDYSPNSLSYRYILGQYQDSLYALFIVKDDQIVYRPAQGMQLAESDHMQIVLNEAEDTFSMYLISPQAAQAVHPYKLVSALDHTDAEPTLEIQGVWRETEQGYNIELRIPLTRLTDARRIGFAIADVDDPTSQQVNTVISTVAPYQRDASGTLYIPHLGVMEQIQTLDSPPGRRIWVLDRQRRVLARYGELRYQFDSNPYTQLYQWFLPPATLQAAEASAILTAPPASFETTQALHGQHALRWYPTANAETLIVMATDTIWHQNHIVGAVIIEETTHSIQTMQQQAMTSLFNKTLVVFTLVTVLLIIFANRLSLRLRNLSNQAEKAIDVNGRVTTTQIGSNAADEIGDLSRSFSAILVKLKQYNSYLEGMASRLSHELRTPIAVVRSSLENLEQEAMPDNAHIYLERAREGIGRLNTIITRLGEATRLEQSMQSVEREVFDLAGLIRSCVEGYRLVYTHQLFEAELPEQVIKFNGAPDLIAQMLDKLISNAVDFTLPHTPIVLRLQVDRHTIHLAVLNQGQSIPADMQERLFESMVSLRPQTGQEPHLGLGLYMVRLIVNYHGGQVRALNPPEGTGAMFSIRLPLQHFDTV